VGMAAGRAAERDAQAFFHAICDLLTPPRLRPLIRKRRGGVDGPCPSGAWHLRRRASSYGLGGGGGVVDPTVAVSDGEAYTRSRVMLVQEISVERERRTNLRQPRPPPLTEAGKAVLHRVLEHGGQWLFLGTAALAHGRPGPRRTDACAPAHIGLYHMVHADAAVRDRAQSLVERLVYSLFTSGRGAVSPAQATALAEAGGTHREQHRDTYKCS
jgi:hypothetical protein